MVGFVEAMTVTAVEGQITPSIVQQEFNSYLPNTLEILPYLDDNDADNVTHGDVTDTTDDGDLVVTQEPGQEPDEESNNALCVFMFN